MTLAGVGIVLMSRRAVERGDPSALASVRATLVRRGVFLLAAGFVNLAVWPGDILRVYGVSLLLASRLLTAPGRRLLALAAGFALGFVVLLLAVDFEQNWDWETLTYHDLWTASGLFRNLFYDGFRSVVPWTGFVLYGMWLGRLDLADRRVNRRVLTTAVAVFVSAEVVSRLLVNYLLAHPSGGLSPEDIRALFGTESMPPLPFFLLSAGGAATAVIALCVRAAAAYPGRGWRPLAATGQMALTWYVAHIVIGLGTLEALGMVGTKPLPVAAGYGLAFFGIAVLLSPIWKAVSRHGPLEWVMRKAAG